MLHYCTCEILSNHRYHQKCTEPAWKYVANVAIMIHRAFTGYLHYPGTMYTLSALVVLVLELVLRSFLGMQLSVTIFGHQVDMVTSSPLRGC